MIIACPFCKVELEAFYKCPCKHKFLHSSNQYSKENTIGYWLYEGTKSFYIYIGIPSRIHTYRHDGHCIDTFTFNGELPFIKTVSQIEKVKLLVS